MSLNDILADLEQPEPSPPDTEEEKHQLPDRHSSSRQTDLNTFMGQRKAKSRKSTSAPPRKS